MTKCAIPGRVEAVVRLGDAIHRILHSSPGFACSDFKPYTEEREVRIMAVVQGYAMVRRKGAAPYVAPLNELYPPNAHADLPAVAGKVRRVVGSLDGDK